MEMQSSKSEIWRHAVVGGVVAFLLAGFHAATEFYSNHRDLSGYKKAAFWAVVIIVLGAGFSLLSIFETYLWKRRSRERIRLDDIGPVDGIWIDAVIQNGEIIEAAIFNVESSQVDGFTVQGKAYRVKSGDIQFQETPSMFKGRRGSLFDKNGFAYVFEGLESGESTDASHPHFGVAYLSFSSNLDSPTTNYFEGAFLVRQEGSVSYVVGRNVYEALAEVDIRHILNAWLQDERVRNFMKELSKLHPQEPLLE